MWICANGATDQLSSSLSKWEIRQFFGRCDTQRVSPQLAVVFSSNHVAKEIARADSLHWAKCAVEPPTDKTLVLTCRRWPANELGGSFIIQLLPWSWILFASSYGISTRKRRLKFLQHKICTTFLDQTFGVVLSAPFFGIDFKICLYWHDSMQQMVILLEHEVGVPAMFSQSCGPSKNLCHNTNTEPGKQTFCPGCQARHNFTEEDKWILRMYI